MLTYVLELEGGHFYIGRTTNLHRRLREHWKGRGARFVRIFPPRRLLEIRPGDVETATTIEYFKRYGLRVRGGPWTTVRLSNVPAVVWREQMSTTLATSTDISQWTIQAPVKNSHNSFVWPITVTPDSKAHPRIQVGQDENSLRIPFGISKFSEASRSCLDYSIAP